MTNNTLNHFRSSNIGKAIFSATTCVLLSLMMVTSASAESVPKKLLGDWSLEMDSGMPAWMSVLVEDDKPLVHIRFYIGPTGPYKDVVVKDGRLNFEIKKKRKNGPLTITTVDVGLKNGKLDGKVVRQLADGTIERENFTGKKIPPMPETAPDLSKVRFGHPISLFNGKDLTGWRAYEPDKIFGWSVEDGVMRNNTPKTDFSATGAYANLRTEAVFQDYWLHIEFLIEADRNSGVYLGGLYEAQVVDRDSRMQGLQGVGAIFGTIEPAFNAGKTPGEWQTYDITVVDRHVTVVLNGQKVIDNQPVRGPTAGAIHTNPAEPGPIYLQGDHTAVSYKDIYLAPVIKGD